LSIRYVIPGDPEQSKGETRDPIIMKTYYVYILTNHQNGVLYTGITSSLTARIFQHRQRLVPGFTKKYGIHKLVYYERFPSVFEAISYEKRLKRWHRQWKTELIAKNNPAWMDLYFTLI
jgi:putative endonuclease